MLTQERIMSHYSLLGDSNVEGSFYFFERGGGLNINVAFRIRKKGGFGLDCSRLVKITQDSAKFGFRYET